MRGREALTGLPPTRLHFIRKNTFTKTKIGPKSRVDLPQYPPIAIREAVINAIVHADYSIKGSSVLVAIFDDRLEITNPGAIPYGLSLEDAISGSSRVRNRVIARTFHVLNLVEQWGSGLQKIIQSCIKNGSKSPKFEELGSQFRVTLYATKIQEMAADSWQDAFLAHLGTIGGISTKDAAVFWNIDVRNARRRLNKLVKERLIANVGTSKNDPYGTYIRPLR